jgi:hypothetical protein
MTFYIMAFAECVNGYRYRVNKPDEFVKEMP